MERNELLLGFGFALVQNPEAIEKFSALPEETKAEILQKAHRASSKNEMKALVDSLSAQS